MILIFFFPEYHIWENNVSEYVNIMLSCVQKRFNQSEPGELKDHMIEQGSE